LYNGKSLSGAGMATLYRRSFLGSMIAVPLVARRDDWTPRRKKVAIEINNRYRVPSARFIKLAKQAGVKFSFSTHNIDRNLGRLEYCLQVVEECALAWQDIFVPRANCEKAIRRPVA
jgi:hypothetical protein